MDDLISRKALLEAYDKAHQGPPGGARKLIEEAPEAVVRCKDCCQNGQCSIQFKFAYPDNPGEWFCAYGERATTKQYPRIKYQKR